MARTPVEKRRRTVVPAHQVVEDVLDREDFMAPATVPQTQVTNIAEELTYEQRLKRQINLAYAALEKYEEKLAEGKTLNLDEERMMISQQDSLRKLETTLQALNSKVDTSTKSDLDLALGLIQKRGFDIEVVLPMFKHNPALRAELEEALSDKS